MVGDIRIFDAWDDEEWTIEGAAVRVSLVCFDGSGPTPPGLDGVGRGDPRRPNRPAIGGATVDLTTAARLRQKRRRLSWAITKGGAFDIPGDLAREWLRCPLNPNGRPNSDVLRPWTQRDGH